MGMTAAERQRAYRRRHLVEGQGERLNLIVGVSVKRQLERLARHHRQTQRQVLERLLSAAETAVLNELDADGERAYLDDTVTQ